MSEARLGNKLKTRKLEDMGKSLAPSRPKKQSSPKKDYEILGDWIFHCEKILHRSPETIRSYAGSLHVFLSYLENRTEIDLVPKRNLGEALSAEALRDFMRDTSAILDAKSQAQRASALRSFLRWLAESGQISQQLDRYVERPKSGRKMPRTQNEESLIQLAEKLRLGKDREEELLFELLYGSGLRLSEASGLQWKSVDLESGNLQIFGKGRRRRLIPMTKRAREILRNLKGSRAQDDGLIWKRARNSRSHRRWVAGWNGLNLEEGAKIHPHSLRHSIATHLLQRGAGLAQIQKLLGHQRLETTQNYTHLDLSDLQKIYARSRPKLKKS